MGASGSTLSDVQENEEKEIIPSSPQKKDFLLHGVILGGPKTGKKSLMRRLSGGQKKKHKNSMESNRGGTNYDQHLS